MDPTKALSRSEQTAEIARIMEYKQQIWNEMDRHVAQMMSLDPLDPVRIQSSWYVRGMSFAIKLFMPPGLDTETAIGAELIARYKAAQAGTPRHTPGVEYQWVPRGKEDTSEFKARIVPQPPDISQISEETRELVKQAVAFGLPTDAIDQTYGLKAGQREAILTEHFGN